MFPSRNLTSSPAFQGHKTRSLATEAVNTPSVWTVFTKHQNRSPNAPTFTQSPVETRGADRGVFSRRDSKQSRWEARSSNSILYNVHTSCSAFINRINHIQLADSWYMSHGHESTYVMQVWHSMRSVSRIVHLLCEKSTPTAVCPICSTLSHCSHCAHTVPHAVVHDYVSNYNNAAPSTSASSRRPLLERAAPSPCGRIFTPCTTRSLCGCSHQSESTSVCV